MADAPRLNTLPTADATDLTRGSIFFIGNATTLIQYGGFTILTDPTFVHMHEEVSIGYGLHAKRLTDPAVDIGDLPPLDLCILSHFHGDHFDQVAERDLNKDLSTVTTPEAADMLAERGFTDAQPLERWETWREIKGSLVVKVTALPGRHGPPVVDLALPDVMGSLVEFETPDGTPLFRLYISGDTLVFDDLEEIPRRYPDIDLGMFHLGGTRVMGVMVTMDAEQGVEALRLVNPQRAIPIHYDDYDVFTSSLDDFRGAVGAAGLAGRVTYLARGETHVFDTRVAAR